MAGFVGTANQVAAWRMLVGGAAMALVALTQHRWRPILHLMRSPVVWGMAISAVMYQVTFFVGAEKIGIGVGTLIAQAVAPTAAGLLTWATGVGRPTLVWLACTVTAIGGMSLITGGEGNFDLVSVLLVSTSGALYALNVVAGAWLVRRHQVSGTQVLTATFTLGAVLAAPVALRGMDWVITPSGMATVLWTGLMATSVAYILFGYGITHLPSPIVSTMGVAEPVWAALIGVLLLGESIPVLGWVGCAIILAALVVLTVDQSRRQADSTTVGNA